MRNMNCHFRANISSLFLLVSCFQEAPQNKSEWITQAERQTILCVHVFQPHSPAWYTFVLSLNMFWCCEQNKEVYIQLLNLASFNSPEISDLFKSKNKQVFVGSSGMNYQRVTSEVKTKLKNLIISRSTLHSLTHSLSHSWS
jgi:hypothetical protein